MEEDSEINIFKRVLELGLDNSVQNCYLDKQNVALGGFEIFKKKLISSKCDSDVANLKDVEDDNKDDDDDDDVDSNDINNFEEDSDEETDSNTLAKSFTQKSIQSNDSTVYDEEDEKDLALSKIPVSITENELKKVLSKHNNPVACDLCGQLISEK
ncbi:unnamed protein product [Brachionus calyciflorus]|uniref:Uncharacterized protein n=1 Tax=Brachionus calyciflorus TaxID=104777 RepID=A0A814RN15_9BILA|nr:unnamed protein product [Brachionus calyciflorus]